MAKSFELEILTPDRTFYRGQAEALVVPTLDGERGVMADSTPLVTALIPGEIFFRDEKGICRSAANSDGFMEVKGNKAFVLCQTVFWPEEMDELSLHDKQERQSAALNAAQTRKEYVLAQTALARTFAKLKVKKSLEGVHEE
jgi:F-type H+-transporting ATPase subunit epsilon